MIFLSKGIEDIVSVSKILADSSTDSKIEFFVPSIGENCTITFNTGENEIVMSVRVNGKQVVQKKTAFFDTSKFTYANDDCGGFVTIKRK